MLSSQHHGGAEISCASEFRWYIPPLCELTALMQSSSHECISQWLSRALSNLRPVVSVGPCTSQAKVVASEVVLQQLSTWVIRLQANVSTEPLPLAHFNTPHWRKPQRRSSSRNLQRFWEALFDVSIDYLENIPCESSAVRWSTRYSKLLGWHSLLYQETHNFN